MRTYDMYTMTAYNNKCKNKVYKTVIGDVVAHLKPQKFTVSSDL